MTLMEANAHFHSIVNIPFGELFTKDVLAGIAKDKGRTGKLLERALGLANTTSNLDFEDGELKTSKCDANGKSRETVAISRISSHIEDLIAMKPFEETWVYEKISNILYIPVCKENKDKPETWYFLPAIHFNIYDEKYTEIAKQLKEDYKHICAEIKRTCETGKNLSTINGKYLQIRTKDGNPGHYHPIFSTTYNREISDKDWAFYFKKNFVNAIKAI